MTTNDFNLLNGLLNEDTNRRVTRKANVGTTRKLSVDEIKNWIKGNVINVAVGWRDSLIDDARYIVHSDLLARLVISVVAIVISGNVAQDVGQAGAIALALANGGLLWSFFGRNS